MSGFQGYEMRFPIIKVKDKGKDGDCVHIVGKNSHDVLRIDSETGAIHYYNLQCGDGTRDGFEFVGQENEYYGPRIEFVSFAELLEIFKDELRLDIEHEKALKAFVDKLRDEKKDAVINGVLHT